MTRRPKPRRGVDRLAVYQEVANRLRATGEHGSELAALLVEQLADEIADRYPTATPSLPDAARERQ